MQRRWIMGGALLILAACGGDRVDENSDFDPNDIKPGLPAKAIEPQVIGFPDIEEHGLDVSGCNFAPDTGGMGAIVLANAETAHIKVGDKLMRLAADKGSKEYRHGVRREYDGLEDSLSLVLAEAANSGGATGATGATDYDGSVTIKDSSDRIVYEGQGIVQCGE